MAKGDALLLKFLAGTLFRQFRVVREVQCKRCRGCGNGCSNCLKPLTFCECPGLDNEARFVCPDCKGLGLVLTEEVSVRA